ncbi:MAG: fibronectin type III domain-containing protein [Bacillota bacterium]|nr:fibronectin type III domain-containing protein [Bacillota bacterium]
MANVEVTLFPDRFVYDGNYHFPEITVVFNGKKLKWKTDYSVSAAGDGTSVGKNVVEIIGKKDFDGTKVVNYYILSEEGEDPEAKPDDKQDDESHVKEPENKQSSKTVAKPPKTSIKRILAKKKAFKVTWKVQKKNTSGYEIRYSLKSNMKSAKTVRVGNNKTKSKTIKKLKSKRTYYVQVRTFRRSGKSRIYSSWSKAKKFKTK